MSNETKFVPCSRCGAPVLPNLGECMICGKENPGRLANNFFGRKYVELRQQQRKNGDNTRYELPDAIGQYRYLFTGAFAVSHTLIAVTIALYLFALLIDLSGVRLYAGGLSILAPSSESVIRLGATGRIPLSFGRVWSFLTAPYLSTNLIDAAINALWLFTIGRTVERFFGGAQTFLLYAASGIVGGIVGTLFGASVMTAGSAALFGLFAGLVVFGRNMHDSIGDQLVRQGIMLGVILLLFDLLGSLAHLFADLGGAAVGYGLATLFVQNLALRYDPMTDQVARIIAIATGALLLIGLIVPLALLG
jgi:rhomboid protease GluP